MDYFRLFFNTYQISIHIQKNSDKRFFALNCLVFNFSKQKNAFFGLKINYFKELTYHKYLY